MTAIDCQHKMYLGLCKERLFALTAGVVVAQSLADLWLLVGERLSWILFPVAQYWKPSRVDVPQH